jgi:acetyl esterase/lipase
LVNNGALSDATRRCCRRSVAVMSVQELEAVRGMLRDTDLALAGPVGQARANFAEMLAGLPDPDGVSFEQTVWAGRPATTSGDPLRGDAVLLYLHGGAFAVGSGWAYRSLWGSLARAARATGLAVDYRMAPEDAFPAAVDDAVAAYRSLVEQDVSPARIAVVGDSAGGGLVVSMLVAARDAGLPLPATAVAISPWADLACAGRSMIDKADEDLSLDADELRTLAARYLGGANAGDPLASPINADLTGLPPLLIQVGTAELLLDDAVRLAGQAANDGVRVRLDVIPGMPHVWHLFAPMLSEARDATETAALWLREHLA